MERIKKSSAGLENNLALILYLGNKNLKGDMRNEIT